MMLRGVFRVFLLARNTWTFFLASIVGDEHFILGIETGILFRMCLSILEHALRMM